MVNAKAYVKEGQLTIIGFFPCDLGIIPFVYQTPLTESVHDGPVNVGAEDLHPAIVKALEESEKPIMSNIQHEQMKLAAQNLVTRARCGDQNAMAMISEVTRAAKSGKSERASRAFTLIRSYIQRNPILDGQGPCKLSAPEARIAGEIRKNPAPSTVAALLPAIKDGLCGAIILANAKPVTKLMLSEIRGSFPSQGEQKAFMLGYQKGSNLGPETLKMSQDERLAAKVGFCTSIARRLQAVRKGAPLKVYSKDVAWELGE